MTMLAYLRRVPRTSILLGDKIGAPAPKTCVRASDPDGLEVETVSPSLLILNSLSELSTADDTVLVLLSTIENGLARMLAGRGKAEERLLRGKPASLREGEIDGGIYDDARRGFLDIFEERVFAGERVAEEVGVGAGGRDTSVVCTTPCTTTSVPGGGN